MRQEAILLMKEQEECTARRRQVDNLGVWRSWKGKTPQVYGENVLYPVLELSTFMQEVDLVDPTEPQLKNLSPQSVHQDDTWERVKILAEAISAKKKKNEKLFFLQKYVAEEYLHACPKLVH